MRPHPLLSLLATLAVAVAATAQNAAAAYVRPSWVPNPADYFGGGLDPLTTQAPPPPAAWPAAEAPGCYYIHPQGAGATDTANPYGYPAKPRVTVPTAFAAGSYVELHGTFHAPTTTWYLTFNGTAAQPIWFRGASAADRPAIQIEEIVVKGSYVFIENLHLGNGLADTNIAGRSHNGSTVDHLVARHNLATGRGAAGTDGGSVFSATGIPALGARMRHIVYYDNVVSNYGDHAGSTESDFHAFTASTYASFVWILGNTASRMGGDGAQIGNATATAPNWTTDWFLDGNTFHTNGENAVDVKGCARGIVSRNTGYGFDGHKISSPGEAFVVHNNPDGIWVMNNVWHSAVLGMVSTGATGNHWIGNLVRDCAEGISPDRGGGVHRVFANTIARCATGFSTTGSVAAVHLAGNIVYDHSARTLEATNSTARNASTATHDLVFEPGGAVSISWGSTFTSAAAWAAADADVVGPIGADPLFVDPAANNFNLQSASPARDAGHNWIPAAQAAFSATFGGVFPGLTLTPVDLNGTVLDATPDIGAFQYAAAPPAVQSFAAWAQAWSLPAGQNGPDNDPDRDGASNALEYALGLDPAQPSAAGLPALTPEGGQRVFRFSHPKSAAPVVWRARLSTDMVAWSDGPAPALESSTATHEVFVVALPIGEPRRFLKLEVTIP